MICIARLSAAVLCTLAVGCSGGAEDMDDSDREVQKAEEQARDLAAPHEEKAKECEAAGKLREAIPHYVAAIQALPEGNLTSKDFELREKVIKIVVSLDPPPAIPDDVQHMFDRAEATAKAAKDEKGWTSAAAEYERALRYLPWETKGNYNAALLHETLKNVEMAVARLRLYLLAAPDAQDRAVVQKKLADLEVVAQRRRELAKTLSRLAGRWECYRDRLPVWKDMTCSEILRFDDSGPRKDCYYLFELDGERVNLVLVAKEDIYWMGHPDRDGPILKDEHLKLVSGIPPEGRIFKLDLKGGSTAEGLFSADYRELDVTWRDSKRVLLTISCFRKID